MIITEAFTQVIPWNWPLELFSKGKSNHYTDTSQEGPALGLFLEKELSTEAQANNWEITPPAILEAQNSCFYLLNGLRHSILSGPHHKPHDWDFRGTGEGQFEHAQQVYDAKRGVSPLLAFCENSLTIRREPLTSAFSIEYPCMYRYISRLVFNSWLSAQWRELQPSNNRLI